MLDLREQIMYTVETHRGCVELLDLYVHTYAISDRYRSQTWRTIQELKKEGKVKIRRKNRRVYVCLPDCLPETEPELGEP